MQVCSIIGVIKAKVDEKQKYTDYLEEIKEAKKYLSLKVPVGVYRITIAKYYKISYGDITSNPENYTDLIVRFKVEGPDGSALNNDWCLVPAYNEVKEAKIKNLEYYVTGAWRYP